MASNQANKGRINRFEPLRRWRSARSVFIIGIFFGARSSDRSFGAFAATRPLADVQIAAAVLKSIALAVVLATAITSAAFFSTVCIWQYRGFKSDLGDAMRQPGVLRDLIGMVLSYATFAWTVIGLMTSATLGGTRVLAVTMWAVLGSFIFGVAASVMLPARASETFVSVYPQVCCLGFIAAAIAVYVASWRLGFIRAWVLALPPLGAIVAYAWLDHGGVRVVDERMILPIGLTGILPALPLAAAPLAVWWNRHR